MASRACLAALVWLSFYTEAIFIILDQVIKIKPRHRPHTDIADNNTSHISIKIPTSGLTKSYFKAFPSRSMIKQGVLNITFISININISRHYSQIVIIVLYYNSTCEYSVYKLKKLQTIIYLGAYKMTKNTVIFSHFISVKPLRTLIKRVS